MYQFRLYNKVNRLYVHICPLPLGLLYSPHQAPALWVIAERQAEEVLCYTAASSRCCAHIGIYPPPRISRCAPHPLPLPVFTLTWKRISNGKLDSHPQRQNAGVFRYAEPQNFPSLNLHQEAMCPIRQVGKPGRRRNRENRYPPWREAEEIPGTMKEDLSSRTMKQNLKATPQGQPRLGAGNWRPQIRGVWVVVVGVGAVRGWRRRK